MGQRVELAPSSSLDTRGDIFVGQHHMAVTTMPPLCKQKTTVRSSHGYYNNGFK